ncbi:MAG: hypothetical protein JRF40_10850 [Deltaproteobacteria bacterium]|nr:hypothetical protein [Deltaproteobacteria bacterium]MBW2219971.1 hypothetical protein [Deltaproteobacteria bacterium]
MNSLNLEEGKIVHEGQWVTANNLAERIQKQINANNLKFAGLAASLETLNTALENSQQVEVKLVLPKDVYEKLKAKGGDDERECIKKAVMAYAGHNGNHLKKNEGAELHSLNGRGPVEANGLANDKEVQCPEQCATGQQKKSGEGKTRFKDHFLG